MVSKIIQEQPLQRSSSNLEINNFFHKMMEHHVTKQSDKVNNNALAQLPAKQPRTHPALFKLNFGNLWSKNPMPDQNQAVVKRKKKSNDTEVLA